MSAGVNVIDWLIDWEVCSHHTSGLTLAWSYCRLRGLLDWRSVEVNANFLEVKLLEVIFRFATELASTSAPSCIHSPVVTRWSELASQCSLTPSRSSDPHRDLGVSLKTVATSSIGQSGLNTMHDVGNTSSAPFQLTTLADSTALWKPAVTIGHKAWCNSSVGCKIEKPSWSAVNYK